ncbi:hypothetical protein MAR_028676 [Mya arenaria]|uniref:BZIP domain-containing protein n=1 Tax=Mya arenaria TaxID=6604 RepID=A0ABY7DE95_MYAAR|nr:hypothetical protein MAR_028676 [Mya arenaria]
MSDYSAVKVSIEVANDATPGSIFFTSNINEGAADNIEITESNSLQHITLLDDTPDTILFATPLSQYEQNHNIWEFNSPEETDTDDDEDDAEQEYELQLISEIISDNDGNEDHYIPESKSEDETRTNGNMPTFSKIDESLVSISPETSSPLTVVISDHSSTIYIDSDVEEHLTTKRRRNSETFVNTNVQTALHSKLSKNIQHVEGHSILDEDVDIFGMFGVVSHDVQKDSGIAKSHHISTSTHNTTQDDELNLEELDSEDRELSESSTSKMTPYIKNELKFAIQYKRLTRGEDELLTPDEIRRRNLRMEVNRRSAKKSRIHQKHRENKIITRYEHSKMENERLKKVKADLTAERDRLKLTMNHRERNVDSVIADNFPLLPST